MAYRSPAFDRESWAGTSGMNLVWAWETDNTGRSFKNIEDALRLMCWLEWTLIVQAIGKRIDRVKLRRRAKERLSRRR